jgi:hypothetical protein
MQNLSFLIHHAHPRDGYGTSLIPPPYKISSKQKAPYKVGMFMGMPIFILT